MLQRTSQHDNWVDIRSVVCQVFPHKNVCFKEGKECDTDDHLNLRRLPRKVQQLPNFYCLPHFSYETVSKDSRT